MAGKEKLHFERKYYVFVLAIAITNKSSHFIFICNTKSCLIVGFSYHVQVCHYYYSIYGIGSGHISDVSQINVKKDK